MPAVGAGNGVPSPIPIVPALLLTAEIPTLPPVTKAPEPSVRRIPVETEGWDVVFVSGVPRLIVRVAAPAAKMPRYSCK
jgi:hypothetical protein